MQQRTEDWNGHAIRFVELEETWWAVAADVVKALGLTQVTRALSNMPNGVTTSKVIDSMGREQTAQILDEKAVYRLIFKSKKKEAVAFQDWVFDVLKELRRSTGLEGFEVFRVLDKEHQKIAMANLKRAIPQPVQVDFVKANTVTNKAVSNMHGHKKMLKKADMTPQMLLDRQRVLDDTVELMGTAKKFGLSVSVSQAIYDKYN